MSTKRSKQKQNCGSYGLLFGSGGFRKSSGGFFGNRRGSGGFWFWWFSIGRPIFLILESSCLSEIESRECF